MKAHLNPPPRGLAGVLLAGLMLVALVQRLYELDRIPPGPFFDEAAAVLLADQVANGHTFPVFIPNYTGHEALYYYLTLPLVKWLGASGVPSASVLALRLTSALIGAASVFMAYALARELFAGEDESEWLGLFSAALMATSFWHVSVSRYGYRAITLPLLQSLMLFALWRGQRRNDCKWIIAAGVLCGLTAYTYLAGRIVPVALAILFIAGLHDAVVLDAVVLDALSRRKRVIEQWAVMALVALIVAAPLGLFFVTHPGTLFERTGQVSILGQPDWPRLALQNTLRVLQVFTVRGDPQIQFNLDEQPMFPGVAALAFYAGLVIIITRLIYPNRSPGRARYVLILAWPLVMLIPSILSDPRQIPHSLRSMGMMPLVFFIPALGWVAAVQWLHRFRWARSQRVMTWLASLVLGTVLTASAAGTFDNYFARWARQPGVYYENNGDVADMARALDALPDDGRPVYVHMLNWYHPTVLVLTHADARLKWIQGDAAFVFPPGPAVYAWPRDSLPDETWAGRFFAPPTRAVHTGPDGAPAFVIHTLDQAPALTPSLALSGTFGGVIEAMGYDVLRDRPSGGKTDIAVYWRIVGRPEQNDLTSVASLEDEWGGAWGQSETVFYPSSQWSPGEVIVQRLRVQTQDGTPPASHYRLKLGWWSPSTGERLPRLDSQGRWAGTFATAGPITVTRRARGLDLNAVNIPHRLDADFGGLALLGHTDWPATLHQGQSSPLTLYWQATKAPLPDSVITLEARDRAGHATVLWRGRPAHGAYPTPDWPAGEFIADRMILRIPRNAAPGSYTLEVQVNDWPAQSLAQFQVQDIQRQWSLPSVSNQMSTTLESRIALVGYEVRSLASEVKVALTWQALREMDQDYAVFVHLVDKNGVLHSQHDGMPVNGAYPTFLWLPGEFVADAHTLALPPNLPPGEYALEVGLYHAETGARLAAGTGDKIVLETITLPR